MSILNRGSAAQHHGATQVISVYREEERIARMSIPALGQGEAYAFTMKFRRSTEAGTGSTTLLFQLGGTNYAPRSIEDCNDKNNAFYLKF